MTNEGSILLVEDSLEEALLLRKAFAAAAILNPLHTVGDSDAMAAWLAGGNPPPSLILLDLGLPRKSGFEIIEWLRTTPEHSHRVIVVLTSSSSARDIDRAYSLGANSYFVKPTSFDDLVEFARMLKNSWLD